MGSAHRFLEESIYLKFNENHFRGKGDMERTRNARLTLMTFGCELDLEL